VRRLLLYIDASVVGGCEDPEFAGDTLALWELFQSGKYRVAASEHALRELAGAPESVRECLRSIPEEHLSVLVDTPEADELADAYVAQGVVGPGCRSDALHVALATVAGVDVLVSWNFRHLVNVAKIRHFSAVNLANGYGQIDIRSPKELIIDEEEL
jgi:hypothetical protein